MPTKKPDLFYKDALCRGLTGCTPTELRKRCSTEISSVDLTIPDSLRSSDEEFICSFDNFMASSFRVPFLPLSQSHMFEMFKKFKAWESYAHPRDSSPPHPYAEFFEPTYRRIEKAHAIGDYSGFLEGLVALVDQILHD